MESVHSSTPSLVEKLLSVVTRLSMAFPVFTLLACLTLACLSVSYTRSTLTLKPNRSDLINPSADYQKRWLDYTQSFGETADMVVVVEAATPEKIKQILDDLGPRVEQETQLFQNVLYKVDPASLRRKGLQYLSPEQLAAILQNLDHMAPVLNGNWNLVNVRTTVRGMRNELEQIQQLPPEARDQALEPLLKQIAALASSLNAFVGPEHEYSSPWEAVVTIDRAQMESSAQPRYLLNDQQTMGFLKAQPVVAPQKLEGAAQAIARMRTLLVQMHDRYPEAHLGLTGIPVLEADEMRDSKDSMIWASMISFVGVALLMFLGFKGLKHPLICLAILAISMAWTFGFTTVSIGHLNILSVSFATMLIGLGDYSVVYLSRYLELRHSGESFHSSVVKAATGVGPGIITAAVTTSVVFLCALLTNFTGVAELGIIAGTGVMLCVVAVFLLVPALLAIVDKKTAPAQLPKPLEGRPLKAAIARFPGLILALSLVCVAILAWKIPSVRYDTNLLHLQSRGLESVDIQDKIFQQSDGSLLFAVSLADSPQKALELKKKFEALPSVRKVEELASMLPAYEADETNLLVQGIAARLAKLPAQPPQPGVIYPNEIGKQFELLEAELAKLSSPTATLARGASSQFLDRLVEYPFEQQMRVLGEFEGAMSYDLLARMQGLQTTANTEPVTVSDLPPAIAHRFIARSASQDIGSGPVSHTVAKVGAGAGGVPGQRWLLQVYPAKQIWDDKPLAEFIRDVRSVDPDATGTPLQTFEATREIYNSYVTAGMYAALATIFLVMLDLRNPVTTIMALMPPALGATMLFGLMGWMNIDLNPANLIILPLIVGLGVDGGVHVIHDYLAQTGRYRMSASMLNSLFVSHMTTVVGFGSMMVAHHRGLFSVGVVLSVGVASCLFISLCALPALLTLLPLRRLAVREALTIESTAEARPAIAAPRLVSGRHAEFVGADQRPLQPVHRQREAS